jgi:Novel toxin 15
MAQNVPGKLETAASPPPPTTAQIKADIAAAHKRQNQLKEEVNVSASSLSKEQVGELAERVAQEHEAAEGIGRSIEAARQAGTLDFNDYASLKSGASGVNSGLAYISEQTDRLAIVHLPAGERLGATLQAGVGAVGAIGGGAARGAGGLGTASRSMQAAGKFRGLAQRFKKPKPVPEKPAPHQEPAPPTPPKKTGAFVEPKKLPEQKVKCFHPYDKKKFKEMSPDQQKQYLKEYSDQLKRQQEAINNMTAAEYKAARDAFDKFGRNPAADAAQSAMRDSFSSSIRDSIRDSLVKGGMGSGAAKTAAAEQTKGLMSKLAALHEPDMVAGGWMKPTPEGLGRSDVNSSIGSSWNQDGRVKGMDQHAQQGIDSGNGNAKMNVKLEPCRGPGQR